MVTGRGAALTSCRSSPPAPVSPQVLHFGPVPPAYCCSPAHMLIWFPSPPPQSPENLSFGDFLASLRLPPHSQAVKHSSH
ncbi:unnamed protein product [Rangifer tarandus platyrhynchus]|uniref:Uncharacterized protein n=2 Tax=Rangifer tarandus platyrhynchus TaxID=3082113 RepID=A0ABN8Y2S0_RANTA|nr:unnamed protein product [Rangifer tarandus platyrhynchus]CAI9692854.1 unnamed protein product [Rangifer tarandus platyrhynchus]